VIHTKRPDVLIPARLAVCGYVVPWAYIDRVGFAAFNQRPLGSGPLRFVSWTRGDRCVLEANPDYWAGRLDLDRVVFRFVPSPAARVEALLHGDADLITQLSPEHGERVASHPSTRVAGAPYAGLYVLAVNAWVAPLNHPLVRQALSLAIDRETMVKELWRGRALLPSRSPEGTITTTRRCHRSHTLPRRRGIGSVGPATAASPSSSRRRWATLRTTRS
jgi:peptide/nickel transport system substrate-binding protein